MANRNTVQRALVLEAVGKLHCHATADEIYAEIVKAYPSISRATVYRDLQRLSDMGQIKKREIPGSPDHYDHDPSEHYHIRCTACGKLFDVDMEYMAGLEEKIKDDHGFTITGHDIFFSGVCPECKKNNTKEK